jgi:serine/threonine protein kinase
MAFTGIYEDRSEKDQKTIIGRGGFGIVTGAEFYGENAVMKKFIKQTRSGQSSASTNTRRTTTRPPEWRKLLKEDHIREFKANIEINCPLTPKFHGLAFCKNQSKEPILITDYVEGKKLSQCYKDIVEDDPEILPRIFLDITSALAHIHNKGFFHGDLSPNNVIVDYDSEVEEVKVNIIDFGLSDTIKDGRIWGHTIDYCAYECLRKDKPKKNLDKVDIFSFGGIMFNVFFRTSFTNYLVKRFLPSEFRKGKTF